MILQIAVKAVNDIVGSNGIIPILLVFSAYPRITKMAPLSLSITIRAKVMRVAIREVRKLQAQKQVRNALAMRNGPNTLATLNLPL